MRLGTVLTPFAIALLAASTADAQERRRYSYMRPARAFAGGSVTVGQPLGTFGDSVGGAFGGSGLFLYALDRRGILALRAEGGAMIYGNERRRIPWGGTVGGRITLDMNTSNDILWFAGGLQTMAPGRTIRPYAAATAGLSTFQTNSTLEGQDDDEEFGRTTNFRDAWKVVYGGAAGLYIPVRGGARPLHIDVGVHYQHNGTRRYLKKGGIQDNPDNTLTFRPISSDANIVSYRIGLTAGVF